MGLISGGTVRYTNDLDPWRRGGAHQRSYGQESDGKHKPKVPGHAERTHRYDNERPEENWENEVRDSDYHPRPSEGYLWRLGKFTFDPQHDKTNKMICAPSDDSDQPGHPPSMISLHCALNGKLRTHGFFMRTAKIMIRLGRCPGWSESSLGAHVILLVLLYAGSFHSIKVLNLWYPNDPYDPPKFSDRQDWANSVDPGQTAPVCHSICIFWTPYSMVKPNCSNFGIITCTTIFVWIFTVGFFGSHHGWVVRGTDLNHLIHATRKPVFGVLQPGKSQSSLLCFRN